MKLKSDYFRIEIDNLVLNGFNKSLLKSDYFRIEMQVVNLSMLWNSSLKSDYFRIEIKTDSIVEVMLNS